MFFHCGMSELKLERGILWYDFIASYPGNISCFPIRLEDVFSVTIFHLPKRLRKTPSKQLKYVYKTCLQTITFKTSSRRRLAKQKIIRWRRLQDFFNTSWTGLHQDDCIREHLSWDRFNINYATIITQHELMKKTRKNILVCLSCYHVRYLINFFWQQCYYSPN